MLVEIVDQATGALRSVLSCVEADCVSGPDAEALLEAFVRAERAAAAGKMAMARRVADTNRWAAGGTCRSAQDYLSRKTGSSRGAAGRMLEAADRLKALPRTTQALAEGELSESQAEEVSVAALADPAAEAALLEEAKKGDPKALSDKCRRVRANASSAESAEARLHASRYLRSWSSEDGAVMGQFRLDPEAGARLLAGLEAATRRVFDAARRRGQHEDRQAYAADALVDLVTNRDPQRAGPAPAGPEPAPGWGPSSAPGEPDTAPPDTAPAPQAPERRSSPARAEIVVHVDWPALVRGYAQGDERCELVGVGPVPVSLVRDLANDCWLKVIVTNGVDVMAVSHGGRNVAAHIRSALEARDPTCVVPGCHVRAGLEIDHWKIPYHRGGPTELWNLCRLCRAHHFEKTHRGARIEGGPGRWVWHPPSTAGSPSRTTPPPPAGARAGPARSQVLAFEVTGDEAPADAGGDDGGP